MAKANITTKSGATIVIEGTAEEVGLLLDRFNDGGSPSKASASAKAAFPTDKKSGNKGRAKTGPMALIAELIESGFFKKPKGLGEIKNELEARAHFYELNSLSTPVLRTVKARALRRIKDNGAWKYVEA